MCANYLERPTKQTQTAYQIHDKILLVLGSVFICPLGGKACYVLRSWNCSEYGFDMISL